MASILLPPEKPTELPTKEEQQLALWTDNAPAGLDLTPHLLLQLEDELERSRLREAFWISVVVHMMVVIVLVMSPKIFGYKPLDLATTADLMKNQNMTYLDLPPDLQKAPKVAPKTNVLSDKNRIAMSQHPSIDKKTLEELRRAGPPRPSAAPGACSAGADGAAARQPAAQPIATADGPDAADDAASESQATRSRPRRQAD